MKPGGNTVLVMGVCSGASSACDHEGEDVLEA